MVGTVFVALLMITAPLPAIGSEWVKVESGTLAWLRSIQFVDDKTGWIGGSSGTLLKTEDGGVTWKKQPKPTSETVYDIHFKNAQTGWLLCNGDVFGPTTGSITSILRTDDGGSTWVRENIADGPERMLRFVAGPGGDIIFVVGEMGTMLSRSDNNTDAQKYHRSNMTSRVMLTAGHMFDVSRGVIVGGAGSIFITVDGGNTWEMPKQQRIKKAGKLNSVFFLEEKTGWAVGNAGKIFQTKDAGRSWTEQTSFANVDLNDVVFLNESFGMVAGDKGNIFSTKDGGKTWVTETSGTRHRLQKIASTGTRSFAIGFGGTVLTLSD